MKKIATLALLFLVISFGFSQKMITRSGEIKLDASTAGWEEIKATNNTVSCIFDETTGDFVSLALVKGFKFKIPLMEEHFNENYIESSKFPKSTFKGKVLNFDSSKLTSSITVYDLEGDLTIHGITKKIKTKVNIALNKGKVNLTSTLILKAQEYNIEIPNLVKEKFAENIKLTINFLLEAK